MWFADHVPDPETVTILAVNKSPLVSFYASGKTFSMGKSADVGSRTPQEIVALLEAGASYYLVLDSYYIFESPQLLPLWNDPSLADNFGLSLVEQDSHHRYQIYQGRALSLENNFLP